MNRQTLKWMARSAGTVASLGMLGTGCFGEPPDTQARLRALDVESRKLNASADGLEERLMGSQAELQLWSELQRRHQNVSALALTNSDEHLRGMIRYLAAQEGKSRKLRHAPVASAEPVGDPAVDSGPASDNDAAPVGDSAPPAPAYTRMAQAGRRHRTVRP